MDCLVRATCASTRWRRRHIAVLLLLVFLPFPFGGLLAFGGPSFGQASAQTYGRYYPETGVTLAPQFVPFFDANGGVTAFGYPVTEARTESGFLVQWTQRERLEWHPENGGTEYEVLLGLLGRERTRGMEGPSYESRVTSYEFQDRGAEEYPFGGPYFPETGFVVKEPFLSYWQERGGIRVFGYPISTQHRDDNGLEVQWFERARFELHPELPTEFRVTLGLLGVEALSHRNDDYLEMQVGETPVTGFGVKLGLSQGGESDDPAFFDNIRLPGAELGPALVRLDNIFNYYDVLHIGSQGGVEYRWEKLDRGSVARRAMGKEPFICLSYMPEMISASRAGRIYPPADFEQWRNLVFATVRHLNVERGLGIRYWEVWNEPNQWDFWRGSFDQYLHLYDVTVEAATAADPTVKVGGPSFSSFEPVGLGHFLSHEAGRGANGRVDFLSWHSYGKSGQLLAAEIRQARALLDKFPQFSPELIISEFNVLQGGPQDTSAGGHTDTARGAIELLASLEAMQWERLDRALLFELKDGPGPQSFWGRWGVLTNDGRTKPVYHALKAYLDRPDGMLPVSATRGEPHDRLGLMAFGSPQESSLMLWYTGRKPARVKVSMPQGFSAVNYRITAFDAGRNNPATSGDDTVKPWTTRNAGDLVFELRADTLLLMEAATP